MTPRTIALSGCLLFALAAVTGCAKPRHDGGATAAQETADEKEPFGRMTIEDLESKMAAAKAGQLKLAIFDNNEHERFDKGHIPGAKWVAFNKVTAADLPADKDTTLVFYCSNEH